MSMRTNTNPSLRWDAETTELPRLTMSELVWGPSPRPLFSPRELAFIGLSLAFLVPGLIALVFA